MPWADNHEALTQAVGAQRTGHNPDGRPASGESDLPPDLWAKMMSGTLSPAEARREWREREPGQRKFNDRLRAEACGGYTGDAQEVLSQAGMQGAPVSVRDEQTGQYANLNEAARAAGHRSMPGDGIVPQPKPPATDHIRQAYLEKQRRRGGGG